MSARRPLKIALVEDNPDLCESWVELLKLDGHEVRPYLDGRSLLQDDDAIQWCDVVVTDYYLPDVNGVELISRVRAQRGALPVVLLSGMRDTSVIETVRRMPRARFVPKPADADDLDAAIHQLVTG